MLHVIADFENCKIGRSQRAVLENNLRIMHGPFNKNKLNAPLFTIMINL